MPLTINVGLSKKASQNYQSTGVSINVTAELDQSLLAKPEELQRQIDDLYGQAQAALERNAAEPLPPQPPAHTNTRPRSGGYQRNGNGNSSGRGYRSNGNGNGRGGASPGTMTDSQRRAINSIATRLGVDPHNEALDVLGVELDELSIRQASELIDHLKGQQPAENGR